MDDPISALDAHVRSQIIKNIYFGKLKDRTRILVTHAIDFLPKADHIVMMDQGRIVCQGTYQEMEKNKEFNELMEINSLNKEVPAEKKDDDKGSADGDTITEESENDEDSGGPKGLQDIDLDEPGMNLDEEDKEMEEKMAKKKSKKSMNPKISKAEESSDVEGSDQGDDEEEETLPEVVYPSTLSRGEKLLKIEKWMTVKPKKKEEVDDKNNLGNDSESDDDDQRGEESNKVNQSVQWETIEMIFKYQHSLWAYGLIMISHFVDQYLTFKCSFMMGEWAENQLLKSDSSAFLGHAIKLVAFNIVNIVFRQARFTLNDYLVDGLMLRIKEDILTKIMRAPVNLFFDVTPNATIMKRFNGEMHEVAHITHRALWIVREVIQILVTLAMLSQQNFWLLFATIPFFYQVWSIQNFAMRSYKEMQRFLDKNFRELGVCQGELFSGSQMIRAMGTQDYAMQLNANGLNLSILTW